MSARRLGTAPQGDASVGRGDRLKHPRSHHHEVSLKQVMGEVNSDQIPTSSDFGTQEFRLTVWGGTLTCTGWFDSPNEVLPKPRSVTVLLPSC